MHIRFLKVLTVAIFSLAFFSATPAQVRTRETEPQEIAAPPKRPQLMNELSLSPEQKRQIRSINQERKSAMQQAQNLLREANLALDEAVYADRTNESLIRERTAEVQRAQANLIETRTNFELQVRRLLTPEQLVRFREMRLKYTPRLQPPMSNPARQNRRQMRKRLRGI